MATTLREKLASLPIERREKIEAKAQQLIAEEMSLRSLRKARQLTQEKVAELLDIRQENVSRIEKRADLLISTLRDDVGSMGGELRLIVEFPDYPPIELSGFGEVEAEKSTAKKSTSQILRKRRSRISQIWGDRSFSGFCFDGRSLDCSSSTIGEPAVFL
jgi:predicted XRE-type DNA-binding protein